MLLHLIESVACRLYHLSDSRLSVRAGCFLLGSDYGKLALDQDSVGRGYAMWLPPLHKWPTLLTPMTQFTRIIQRKQA